MSKKSEREARERKEQNEQERLLKFSTILKGYLNTFGQLYRQEITDDAVAAYQMALQHLSPEDLKIACDEAIRECKFFPNPAEILEALQKLRNREPAVWQSAEFDCRECGGSGWRTIPAPIKGYPHRVLAVKCTHKNARVVVPPTKEQKEELTALWDDAWDKIRRMGKYKTMAPSPSAKSRAPIASREPGED